MRFLIKFAFWMAVVMHYLPDADTKASTPPAKVTTQSKTSTTKPEADRLTCGFFSQKEVEGGAYKRTMDAASNTLRVEAAGRRSDGTPYYDVITYSL